MDAETTAQEFPLASIGFSNPDVIGITTISQEPSDQAASHIAAADKTYGDVFHLHLVRQCGVASAFLGCRFATA